MNWELEVKEIDFISPWRISGVEVDKKQIILVRLINSEEDGVGEISYGSKEEVDLEVIKRDLMNFSYIYKDASVAQFSDLARLLDTVDFEYPRVRFAIESAFLDYLVHATEITPWRIIGTNEVKSVNSVSSISIFNSTQEGLELLKSAPKAEIYKIKVSKETFDSQLDFINASEYPLVLDGNESWGSDVDALLTDLAKIKDGKVLFIEEPLYKNSIEAYRRLKKESNIEIFLDETVADHKHLNVFGELCHGVVLKASKSNSLMRVVMQMAQAKKLGLKTMLGCMVESSVGIASLFPICYGFDYYDFDGFTKLVPEQEPRVFWDKGKVVLSSMN